MKVSLRAIQELNRVYKTGFDPFDYTVDETIERIGLQLGAIEEVIDQRRKYLDNYIVKVVACEKHPDADKLSVCKVDDGGVFKNIERDSDGLIQVVCGAPNVHAGMWAVWLPPGATVPETYRKEPFVLESIQLRGQKSNGMLASLKELDFGDDHEGILELTQDNTDQEIVAGQALVDHFRADDVIIDLENKMFTHRPDCFGTLGVARELSGIFDQSFNSPEWYKTPIYDAKITDNRNEDLPIEVANEAGEKVWRFMLQSVSGVTVGSADYNTQLSLRLVDIKSVNSIVDWTNYFMHLTAQPLHAYDYDKVKALSGGDQPVIKTRLAQKGEKLKLLNGKEIELDESDIVIATDQQVIGLAGVMGGTETEVDENTKNIILECGSFDMYSIRRTSMRHGLFTDAVTRFNKGQSPLQNDRVLAKITEYVCRFSGGTMASPTYDLASFDLQADNLNRVEVSLDFINNRLGSKLTAVEVKEILENVEFKVAIQTNPDASGDILRVEVPFWRMDIAIAEDVVEEVGRLYGYNKLPVNLPMRLGKPASKNPTREFATNIRSKLMASGANEALTYSFVHKDLLEKVGIDPEASAYHLRNALSPDLQYYRPSLLPSLLAKVAGNLRAQAGDSNNKFVLYEIGKAHVKDHFCESEPEIPAEYRRLALVFAADSKSAQTLSGEPYYTAKKYLEQIVDGQAIYLPLDSNQHPVAAPYQLGRSAIVELDGQAVGVIGELQSSVRKKLKLPQFCAGFEVDIEMLQKHLKPTEYQRLSNFPSIHRDITFEVDDQLNWQHLKQFLDAELKLADAEEDLLYQLQAGDIYQAAPNDKRRISFHLEIASFQKTLQNADVNQIVQNIAASAEKNLGAKII